MCLYIQFSNRSYSFHQIIKWASDSQEKDKEPTTKNIWPSR